MRQHPHPARSTNASGAALRLRSTMRLKPSRLALALASASLLSITTNAAWAQSVILPTGGSVVHGQATIVTSGDRMTVTNSNNAILNWQTFSVGTANAVRFDQPSVSSQVLNRVLGNDPSRIFGSLSSNGKVWLLNPNGVLFGRDARVDVAGLVASTLNVNDRDWLAGRFQLTNSLAGGSSAAVINQGQLRTTLGGQVALLAGEGGVRNEGLIEAPGGQVLLAAGQSIDLVDTGAPNLALRVTAPQGEALNLGSVLVAGGRIDIQAAIVNQQGIVRADAVGQGAGGEVRLQSSESMNLAAGSITSASGASAGRVSLDGGAGTTLVAGNVAATASAGAGGRVTLDRPSRRCAGRRLHRRVRRNRWRRSPGRRRRAGPGQPRCQRRGHLHRADGKLGGGRDCSAATAAASSSGVIRRPAPTGGSVRAAVHRAVTAASSRPLADGSTRARHRS